MLFGVRRLAALTTVCLVALTATPVLAVEPANDDIGSPIEIGVIPHTNPQDTTEATTGPTDPGFCHEPEIGADRATVWYQYTPTDAVRLEANTFGSDYDTTLYVGTPDGDGGLEVIACNDDTFDLQSRVRFDAEAGVTYLLMVGTCCGPGVGGGGSLVFTLDVAPPLVPLELTITLDATGSFNRAGVATISGSLRCSGGDFVELYGALRQDAGRFRIEGWGWDFFPCSGETETWQLQIFGNGKFAGGPALAYVEAFACGEEDCAFEYAEGTVRLRK
jgi:hypothetical protein